MATSPDAQDQIEPGDVLRYDQAAALLAIPLATLYSMVHHRQLPHYRVGARTVLFRKSELAVWLADRAVRPADTSAPASTRTTTSTGRG
jgi:excisionase family DNA binding protein